MSFTVVSRNFRDFRVLQGTLLFVYISIHFSTFCTRESCATKWEIHPLLLDDATDQNSYSPYASALTPTNSELQGLLKQDSHIPRKRPKKIDTNKHDKRRRQPGNNRQKTNR